MTDPSTERAGWADLVHCDSADIYLDGHPVTATLVNTGLSEDGQGAVLSWSADGTCKLELHAEPAEEDV